jgi:LysM repeat protein
MTIPTAIRDAILTSAAKHAVDPNLVAGVISAESAFDEKALGDANGDGAPYSFGLMQLHIQGAGFGHRPRLLLNVPYNVDVGAAYLRRCLDAFGGDVDLAVSAYNQGIGGARSRGIINPAYVAAVMQARDRVAASGELAGAPPTSPPITPPTPTPPPPPGPGRTYTVAPGDNLTKIAHAQYGIVDPRGAFLQGIAIWRANRGLIGPDPDLIKPGQVLVLP